MSYETERQAIEGYFAAQWSATPVHYDAHSATIVAPCIRLTIQNGTANQLSFGAPGANKVRHVGLLQIEIYVDGGAGSTEWRGYAQSLETLLLNKKLASDGTIATTSGAIVVDFGKGDLRPYIAGKSEQPPHLRVTMNAPFVRDEAKA